MKKRWHSSSVLRRLHKKVVAFKQCHEAVAQKGGCIQTLSWDGCTRAMSGCMAVAHVLFVFLRTLWTRGLE